MPIKGKKSLLDYIVTVGTRGLSRLFALVVTIVIARTLTLEEFGIYSLFFGIFILIFQAEVGVNIAHVRFSKQEITSKKNVLRYSLVAQIFIVIILSIIGWPLSILLAKNIGLDTASTLYLGFICSALLGFFGVWFGVLQSEGRFLKLGVFSFIFNLLLMLYIAGSYIIDAQQNLTDILLTYLIISLILGIPSLIYLWRESASSENKKHANDFYRMVGLNVSVTMFYFMYRYIDVYFIKYFSDLATVAIYSAAMKTSMLLNILTGSLPTILLPKAVTALKTKDKLINYISKSALICTGITACFLIFYFLSPFVLTLLFGDQYSSAGDILQWLVIGWIINTIYIPVSQLYYALNKVGWRIFLEFTKLIIAAACFIILIPKYGALGAAYSLLIAICITLIISVIAIILLIKKHYLNEKNLK